MKVVTIIIISVLFISCSKSNNKSCDALSKYQSQMQQIHKDVDNSGRKLKFDNELGAINTRINKTAQH